MADEEHVARLKSGVGAWNDWYRKNYEVRPDLSGAALSGMNLSRVNFSETNLDGADLSRTILSYASLNSASLKGANLNGAILDNADLFKAVLTRAQLNGANLLYAGVNETDLREASLIGANLNGALLTAADATGANFNEADLISARLRNTILVRANLVETRLTRADASGAKLGEANLTAANLIEADLRGASLAKADLSAANLTRADLRNADLTGCRVWGISAWQLKLQDTVQHDLVITSTDEPTITVDNVELAQFIYLLVNNQKLRDAIDTITSKVVLILGRFSEERKAVLDRLRDELRKVRVGDREASLVPVVFDFAPASTLDVTDTVTLLARMARFVVADLTDPRSVQQELTLIAPQVMVAIRPIILAGQKPWSMFDDLRRRSHGLLPVHEYRDVSDLIEKLQTHVVAPAEAKRLELLPSQTAT
jgi:uncharacterized protein YjbI with pentapeptide repeats